MLRFVVRILKKKEIDLKTTIKQYGRDKGPCRLPPGPGLRPRTLAFQPPIPGLNLGVLEEVKKNWKK